MTNNPPPPVWDESLAVGIPSIDEAHKTIIAQLGALYGLFFGPLGSATAKQQMLAQARLLVIFLERYTREHFNQEEAIMRCQACDFYEQHAKAHRQMLLLLDAWTAELQGHESQEGLQRVIVDFGTWFEQHIRTADCRLRGSQNGRPSLSLPYH